MGLDANYHATAIVRTNDLRQEINLQRAKAIRPHPDTPESIVYSYAVDKTGTVLVDSDVRKELLEMHLPARSTSLPSVIPLYVGMPVILRSRNLCTELGVSNGSQGILVKMYTASCARGYTYCPCVIVHFPLSSVQLSGLPSSCFPIYPIPWRFTTLLRSGQQMQITRHQLPIQPAFAVTGQSAQGKTLPSVLVNLAEGGFSAYVAASRARSSHNLYLTEPVTLQQLNKPLPQE
ncbi:hypothetical protein EV714DRAFT_209486, partial [Schizophyllum commune]